jgi:hypothetical protein
MGPGQARLLRCLEEFEHGPVAQAEWITGVWQGGQPGDFVGIEGSRQMPGLFFRVTCGENFPGGA